MKALFKSLLLIGVLSFVLYACEDDDTKGPKPTITFNGNSTKKITADLKFNVSGEVTSPNGSIINSIAISCLYKDDQNKVRSALIGNIKEGDVIFKNADNDYTFKITEASPVILGLAGSMTAIKVDVVMKDGEAGTKSWDVTAGEGGDISKPHTPNELTKPSDHVWVIDLEGNPKDSTGLEIFGLAWQDVTPEGFLVIKRWSESTTHFAEIDASTWNLLKRDEAIEIVKNSAQLSKYEKIKAVKDTVAYTDKYLGVIYKSDVYLLNITESYEKKGMFTISVKCKK